MKISNIVYDYGKYILTCLAIILTFIIAILLLRMNTSEKKDFAVGLSEISGSASVNRDSANVVAYTGMYIRASDIVTAAEDSSVTLKLDSNSFITLEEGTSVYFTDAADNKIVLNVTSGAVLCSFGSKGKILTVKTPNSAISSDGGIFRLSFNTAESVNSFANAYITDLFCFDGNVAAQLYDKSASPVEGLMQVLPKKACELISADGSAFYGYLNQDIVLDEMPSSTVQTLITVSASRPIGYTLSELNSAMGRVAPETEDTEPVSEETTAPTPTVFSAEATQEAVSPSEMTPAPETTTPAGTTTVTTTAQATTTTRATTRATPAATVFTTPVTTVPTIAVTETTTPVFTEAETELASETEPTVTRRSVTRRIITTTEAPELQTVYRPRTEPRYFGPEL